ncbi:MAG TPA: cell wall-binding repeat-containing protein [Microbacterium sp.]|nr:cell wall-binding repeat-containing protein [Microbacterium sp.]
MYGARLLIVALAAVALVASLLSATPARASAPASAPLAAASAVPAALGDGVKTADLSLFQPGNIISDATFFNRGTMSEAQIQAFLQAKVPSCEAGYTCLKDWYDTSRTTAADAMCGAYSGGTRERASTIIYKVAQACGINPQVLIVMLQKEQGLVNHVWPSEWRYTIAMGQGCPDTAACDTRYYGFFNQMYGAAWQLKRYANPAGTSQYFTWYAPGKTWNVRWHPNAACGSSPVYIQNQATANLYYYTPYQPNPAAIRAGYGEGDGCSSYGNRNFFQYFNDWFGSTQSTAGVCTPPAAGSVTASPGEFAVNVASLNARRAPTTECETNVVSLTQGTIVTRLGVYGEWWQVRLNSVIHWVHSAYLSPTAAPTYTTNRISGADRYETSAAVSRSARPAGAPTVYLASGLDFPDALSAAAAAAANGGALLLTGRDSLPGAIRVELLRLAPTRVVLAGGEGVLSPALADSVAQLLPAARIDRVAGADRYATSRAIAQDAFPATTTAYLATGGSFADALAASAIAGGSKSPVLIVAGDQSAADQATVALLRTLGITRIVIAGGAGAVTTGIESTLVAGGFAVSRIGGADRYETSRLLNAAMFTGNVSRAYLATGVDFPDALSGAVLAGTNAAPLLSQPTTCMVGTAKDWLKAKGTTSVTLIGGPGALADGVLRSERC